MSHDLARAIDRALDHEGGAAVLIRARVSVGEEIPRELEIALLRVGLLIGEGADSRGSER